MVDPQTPQRRESDASPESRALRLLIVDDDENFRAWARVIALRQGWIASTAADAESALGLLDREAFDLLVIDYQMPRIDGMELIARIRADDRLRNIYAVMLSGHADLDTRVAALTAGFDDFMAKSSSEDELAAKLMATRRVLARQMNLDVAVRRLYGLATRDDLTGVFNRRFFIEETARLLARGSEVCLVLFDLDDFKVVNDTFGHVAGDRVLHDVGALFHASTRSEDLIARYGGDEFVLITTGPPIETVEALAERLVTAIGELRWTDGTDTYGITATTGIATSALLDSPDVEQLLNAADRDLYKNKWLRKPPAETLEPESLPASDPEALPAVLTPEAFRRMQRRTG